VTQDLNIALVTSLNDRLVAPLQRSLGEVEKLLQGVEKQLGLVTEASKKSVQVLSGMQGPAQATRQVVELSKQTKNALTLAEQLQRAWSVAGNTVKGVASGVAAFQAGKYVMAPALQTQRTYERQLADAANIAYADKSPAERRAGMLGMNDAVERALRVGGGSRESALKGMNDLYAANIDKEDVNYLLPHIQKYATAGNADPSNIANLAIFGLRSLKLSRDQIPLMLDKTLASTNVGSMELDNLAKWMPQIGAVGSQAGMTGMKGYELMLAGVQTSRLTAGTKDEAGTNFKDLLSMIQGHALMTAAKSMGLDAAGSIAKHIGTGGNALSGTVALADYVANHDPRFAELQKKLDATQKVRDAKGNPLYSPEQEDIMRQQAALFSGSALGKLFHNQQSMQALVALRANRDYFNENLVATGGATGQVGESNMALIRTTNDFKEQQLDNEKLFCQNKSLSSVSDSLGKLAEGTTNLYQKYPEYAATVEKAKWAVGGLAAAAAAAGGVLGVFAFLGKGGAGGAAAAAAGGAAASRVVGPAGLYSAGGSPPPIAPTGWAAAAGMLGKVASIGATAAGPLMWLESLTQPSEEDIAALKRMDVQEAMAKGGHRGKGFADPRRLGGVDAVNEPMEGSSSLMDLLTRMMEAMQNRPIVLTVDGQVLADTLNDTNGRNARRN